MDNNNLNNNGNNGNNNPNSSSGLQPNVAGMLSYLLGFITGIIFLLIEKENKFVRFHAMQSTILSIALTVLGIVLPFIPVIGWIISILLGPLGFILWILLMYKAYNNEWFELPVIGNMAKEQINK